MADKLCREVVETMTIMDDLVMLYRDTLIIR